MARLNGKELNKAAYATGGYLYGQDLDAPTFDQSVAQATTPAPQILNVIINSNTLVITYNYVATIPAIIHTYVSTNGGSFSLDNNSAANEPTSVGINTYTTSNGKSSSNAYDVYMTAVIGSIETQKSSRFHLPSAS